MASVLGRGFIACTRASPVGSWHKECGSAPSPVAQGFVRTHTWCISSPCSCPCVKWTSPMCSVTAQLRRTSALASVVLLACLPRAAKACSAVRVDSPLQPFLNDKYILGSYTVSGEDQRTIFQHNNRPIYISASNGPARYLYHIQIGDDLGGRWLLGGDVGVNSAWAFVQSWAVAPHLVPQVSDRAVWRVYQAEEEDSEEGPWLDDPNLTITCEGPDTTVFISSQVGPSLGGFYVETAEPSLDRSVFVSPNGLYLYATGRNDGGALWIVGEEAGSISGLAFVGADVDQPSGITKAAESLWSVAVDGIWHEDLQFRVLGSDAEGCIDVLLQAGEAANKQLRKDDVMSRCGSANTTWEVVRLMRTAVKPTEHTFRLNNGLNMPLVGYGTGAMNAEDLPEAVEAALQVGYRLLDTASAYGNEDVIGDVLNKKGMPSRDEVVLVSKLWFSELGFEESVEAAKRSLIRLQTDYLDAYLIHWPQCYPEIQWMDCSEQSGGTWQQSYRALEKLYAEGVTLSIGVSNFDEELLEELLDMASTTPQVLSNFWDPLHQDHAVLEYARANKIFFTSYSSLRQTVTATNDDHQYVKIKRIAADIAAKHRVSPVQVILKQLVQQEIGVIPRSTHRAHLAENLDLWRFDLTPEQINALTYKGPRRTLHDEL